MNPFNGNKTSFTPMKQLSGVAELMFTPLKQLSGVAEVMFTPMKQ